jgi:predicted Fe-Mo cluster-binding NifX family protein
MMIAVTASGPTLDSRVEARFGRCPYFLIIDTETMALEAIENPNVSLGGGAGPQSAQIMADRKVSVVLTGNCGPNAFQTFGAAGIEVITGVSGLVRQAVEQYKAGALARSAGPSVYSHFGMGGGMGRGMGMGGGMGRGMGMGRMMSAYPAGGPASEPDRQAAPQGDREEIKKLKDSLKNLHSQIAAIEKKIKNLETPKA